jgi:hypothetical protein
MKVFIFCYRVFDFFLFHNVLQMNSLVCQNSQQELGRTGTWKPSATSYCVLWRKELFEERRKERGAS